MIGKTVSHYRILEKLGEGGMGVVYKAEDTKLKRTVALKFLPQHLLANEEDKTRFLHEAQSASALNHPNIMTIYEIDDVEDQAFIAMEYVEGETLKDKLEKGPLKTKQLLNIAIAVADGLDAAHEQEIVHRDIKSENIMISKAGLVKIMDFGLAKRKGMSRITKAGSTLGTLAYMSPEQAEGLEVDRRSDLFSFGVVMYEMATGQLPFKGEHDAAILYSIVNEEPLPVTTLNPNIHQELERIIHKALGKEVEDRYQHADDMAADLKKQKKDLESGRARTDLTKPKIATKNRMYLYGGFVLLLIFLVVAGLFLFTGNEKAIDSIAVLPMENISGDPEQEYFADGMTEALITNLSKIRVLKVISRTSAMRYKGTDKPLPEIARELNVSAVVEGTVLRIGNRVRITAQLIEAATDQHLWAESYERDLRDVLALQSEVARAIAREIRIAITQEEEARLATALPVNPEAYQLYLLGRFFWNKHTEEGLKKAVKFFGRSVEKEPNYAPAYAGLADTYIYFEDLGLQRPKEAYPRAKAAAMKALKLDSTLAEAHSSLGLVRFWFDWDWSGAETAFKRAIELNPSYSIAHLRYAQLLMVRGRLVEAHTAITRAWELDPLSLRANIFLGMYSYLTRAYDHAIEQHKKTLELNPSYHLAHFYLGLAYEAKGLEEDAIAAFEKAVTTGGGTIAVAWLGHAYAEAGYKSEALKILDELKERSNGEYVPPFAIAVIYEGLGDTDSTFEWLGKAYQERSSWIPFIKGLPWFDSLHGDPRFTVLLKKIGLEK